MTDKAEKSIPATLIRETYFMWDRLWFCIAETGHAWTNIWTEYARGMGLPTPQGIGKVVAIAIPVGLIAAVAATIVFI